MNDNGIRLKAKAGTLGGRPWTSGHLPNGMETPATAPYNFVPLPEKVVVQDIANLPEHDAFVHGTYTGRIDCTLETVTPLYVRGAWLPANFRTMKEEEGKRVTTWQAQQALQKNRPEAFHHGDPDKPTIPASTLRGMVRAVARVATHSLPEIASRRVSRRSIGNPSPAGSDYLKKFLNYQNVSPAEMKIGIRNKATYLPKAGYVDYVGDRPCVRPARTWATNTPIGDVSFFRVPMSASITRPTPLHHCMVWFDPATVNAMFHPHGTDDQGVKRLLLGYALVPSCVTTPMTGWTEGTLVWTGGVGASKKLQYIFGLPDHAATPLAVSDAVLSDLRFSLKESKPIGGNVHPRDVLFDGDRLRPGCPVFYFDDGAGVRALGYTMMFRLPYEQTVQEGFVPRFELSPTEVDLTDSIFGWARSEPRSTVSEQSRRGRIRFTSARFSKAEAGVFWKDRAIVPKTLGSPKPTTYQHYLEQPSGRRENLRHYGDAGATAVRGFKRYWPVRDGVRDIAANQEEIDAAPGQYTNIRPVNRGVTFAFTIRFHNLRAEELGALLWSLQPRDAANPEYKPVHQLGMAKSLGLGTVELTPTLRIDDRRGPKGRYTELFDGQGLGWHQPPLEPAPNSDELVHAFMKAMDVALGADFSAHPRIADLRALMDRHGAADPDRAAMILTVTPRRNDFRARKVLPSARSVRRS